MSSISSNISNTETYEPRYEMFLKLTHWNLGDRQNSDTDARSTNKTRKRATIRSHFKPHKKINERMKQLQ